MSSILVVDVGTSSVRSGIVDGDARVSSVVQVPVLPSTPEPGTVDIDLQVNDELPLSGTLELNNQHASGTARERLQAGLRYANLFQLGHALSLNLASAWLRERFREDYS